jgi:hypothetical protein
MQSSAPFINGDADSIDASRPPGICEPSESTGGGGAAEQQSAFTHVFDAHTFVAAASLLYPMSHCASDEHCALLTQHSLAPHVVDAQAPVLTR